jgi:2-keto-4-pentenoate hydratase
VSATANIDAVADRLATAERSATPVAPLTDAWPDMAITEAYEVQMANVRRRVAAGGRVRGYKVGLTSKAMQRQLGVDVPDYGHLFGDMFVCEEEEIPRSVLIAPRVEPEIAFVLGEPLCGPGITVADVMRATAFVVPALEIIDSRVADWRIQIQDTIADNASAARVVLAGRPHNPRAVDLPHVPMVLRVNGGIEDTGTGAAVLGNPVSAVAWLANALSEYGVAFDAGDVVLSGSFCASVFANAGESVTASFGALGTVTTRFGQ